MLHPLRVALGQSLKDIREGADIPLEHIAEYLELSPQYYANVENGSSTLGISNILRLRLAFVHKGIHLSFDGLEKILIGIVLITEINKSQDDMKQLLWAELRNSQPRLHFLIVSMYEKWVENDIVSLLYPHSKKKFLANVYYPDFRLIMHSFLREYDFFLPSSYGSTLRNAFLEKYFEDLTTKDIRNMLKLSDGFVGRNKPLQFSEVIYDINDAESIYAIIDNPINLIKLWDSVDHFHELNFMNFSKKLKEIKIISLTEPEETLSVLINLFKKYIENKYNKKKDQNTLRTAVENGSLLEIKTTTQLKLTDYIPYKIIFQSIDNIVFKHDKETNFDFLLVLDNSNSNALGYHSHSSQSLQEPFRMFKSFNTRNTELIKARFQDIWADLD